MDYDDEIAHYEGYQYVPRIVQTDLGGGREFPRAHPHPANPSGELWDENKVAEHYPKLAEKYDFTG